MKRRNGFILGLLFCILVVEIIILAPKEIGMKGERPAQTQKQSNPENAAEHTMQGVSSIGSRGENKEWELTAARAVRMTENEDWIIEQVKVKFFGQNGVTYTVTGKKGDVDVKKNNIRISGDVVTRSTNGYTFVTDEVFYESTERRLVTPYDVTMTGPLEANGTRLKMTGTDLVAEMGTNEISIAKNVKARKSIRDGKVASISSNSAKFSGKTNSARFLGNVVIDVETLRITGPEAKFVYRPDGQTVESMNVEGGVKVSDVDKWATSQSVNVQFDEDRFVFNGAPRVVQMGDELIGDEIIFTKGGREVQVSRARAKIESSPDAKAGR